MSLRPSSRAVAARIDLPRGAALFGIVAVMAMSVMLSACNTTAGAGQDVTATGRAITRGASDVKQGL